MIVVINTEELTAEIHSTLTGAAKYYGLSTYQIINRIKTGKLHLNTLKFSQSEVIINRKLARK